MKFENFLASRILSYKRYKNTISSPIIKISILSIIIAIIVINFSVSIGFGIQNEIRDKFITISGDYYISNFKNESFSTYHPIDLNNIDNQFFNSKNFSEINKVVYNPGIIPLNNTFLDIVFKGIDNNSFRSINQFVKNKDLINIEVSEVLVSDILAKKLNVKKGDYIKFLFFKDQNSKIPLVRNLKVLELYNSSISEFDSKLVFGNIKQSQLINKWNDNFTGGLEVYIEKNDLKKQDLDFLFSSIPPDYDVQKISERFPEIFNWIKLFDTNIYLIVILMIAVGGINMITALLVTVLDKTKLIARLKILGANNSSIRTIFMINGFFMIMKGIIWGNIISLSLMIIQKRFSLVRLDPMTYYSDHVPVEIDPIKILLINLVVIVISMLMLLIPSGT
ncbi:MAG: FtsX-like permease family protein, partial [Bacteroidota bacterium]|nr:FtsX-like permease family protein [Bacteroidota bacterium]